MNKSEKLFKNYLETIKNEYPEGSVTWKATYGSEGYNGEISFKYSDFKEDQACVVINRKVLCEETNVTVTLMIYGSNSTGWTSIPCKSDLLGERIGEFNLSWLFKNLPDNINNHLVAEKYLAQNPDMLISKLSNTLNMQKTIINNQQDVISDLDWNLSNILDNATGKCKSLLKLHSSYFNKGKFSAMVNLRKLLKGLED